MSYPHPFSKGGFLIVIKHDVDSLLKCVADIYRCLPPLGKSMNILRRSELSQLALPGLYAWPYFVNERPHLPYLLRHKADLLYGSDIREEIPAPGDPRLALMQHVEACKLYVRSQGVVKWLSQHEYMLLIRELDNHFRYLMATALLMFNHWDVEFESLPEQFSSYFANHPATETWQHFHALARTAAGQEDQRATALEAAWLFERFLQQVNRQDHE